MRRKRYISTNLRAALVSDLVHCELHDFGVESGGEGDAASVDGDTSCGSFLHRQRSNPHKHLGVTCDGHLGTCIASSFLLSISILNWNKFPLVC